LPFLIALAIGLASGAHTATWGMYKDCPHEGFTWPRYFRSILLSAFLALAWQAGTGLDLAPASARVVLFGLTYVSERGIVELYKTYLREEDQSKYTIPMQFHVFGRLVASRAVRWSVAAGWVGAVALVMFGLRSLEGADEALTSLLTVLLVGSIGGWMSAFGGVFKDAPIEDFETLKFFRSPLVALSWSLLLACFTQNMVFIVFGALGYTVATIETYKTFFSQQASREVRRQGGPLPRDARLPPRLRAPLLGGLGSAAPEPRARLGRTAEGLSRRSGERRNGRRDARTGPIGPRCLASWTPRPCG
jgi:hypothetical protein